MGKPSNWHNENGFEFALFPAKSDKPQSLIIYMHGVGDTAQNFDSAAAMIQEKIPGADVIALQAPILLNHPDLRGAEGYTWIPYGGPVMPQVKTWLSHVFNRAPIVKQVEAFSKAQLAKRGLAENDLAYMGNSMGAIVALQTGLSGRKEVAAVASVAGSVPPFTKVRSKPDIFLQMGEWDEIFNADAPAPQKGFLKKAFTAALDKVSLRHGRTKERLMKKGVAFSEKMYPAQGHMLDGAAWRDSADFVAKALEKSASPRFRLRADKWAVPPRAASWDCCSTWPAAGPC